MNKKIVLSIITLAMILAMATPLASASTTTYTDTKGAVAYWLIPNNSGNGEAAVYAVLSASNNGKDGTLYIQVIHNAGTANEKISTSPLTSVQFKWNMDHITVSVNQMAFSGPSPGPWSKAHNIEITFDALPKSENIAPSNGITIDGSWKLANAGLIVDGNAIDGAHECEGAFEAEAAYIYHGDLSLTA